MLNEGGNTNCAVDHNTQENCFISTNKLPKTAEQKLRKSAEDKAARQHDTSLTLSEPMNAQKILHELQVHQIELEMQNAKLQKSMAFN